ncbi:HD domain-containing protein 2 isoform X2 [Sus scrofa]|uniref:HD domain-containing protein 2 isoform X2 n=1 Tax=Sus scrofa TaxID=9823 RepID=UPI0003AF0411|nr:HD domain-containing protein 2 isoform X2 [Sus scrofa]
MASASSAAALSGRGARNLLQFLRLVGQLKRVPRTGWVYRNVQKPESVSDHMYRMAVMALVTKDEHLNKDRCVRLALVHDMAECIVGDIAPADNIPKEEKHRREEEAMKQLTQLLPEDLRKELYELWEEYETQSSAEARYVKQLDQCEMILQASEYEDLENKPGRLQDFYDSTTDVRLFIFNCLDSSKKCCTYHWGNRKSYRTGCGHESPMDEDLEGGGLL